MDNKPNRRQHRPVVVVGRGVKEEHQSWVMREWWARAPGPHSPGEIASLVRTHLSRILKKEGPSSGRDNKPKVPEKGQQGGGVSEE